METTLIETSNTPLDQVHEIIRYVCPELDGTYEPAESLSDLGVDSMSLMEVLVQIEKRFGFMMTDAEVAVTESIQDVLDVIAQHS